MAGCQAWDSVRHDWVKAAQTWPPHLAEAGSRGRDELVVPSDRVVPGRACRHPCDRGRRAVMLALTTVEPARIQFAMTSLYHFLFVPLTLGLAPLVAVMQTLWYRSG